MYLIYASFLSPVSPQISRMENLDFGFESKFQICLPLKIETSCTIHNISKRLIFNFVYLKPMLKVLIAVDCCRQTTKCIPKQVVERINTKQGAYESM